MDGVASRIGAGVLQWKLQRRALQRLAPGERGGAEEAQIHQAAERGIAGAGDALPHLDPIQRSFGRHDVSGVQAHTDATAAGASRDMGALAYATGDHVAFAEAPSLHTAAHEAAHVVQQRAGVHLKGGVGEEGDAHERHADAVADRVVAGQSAEGLLDAVAGGGSGAPAPVQRVVQRKAALGPDMRSPDEADMTDPKTRALVDDPQIRRFKDAAEMKAFAAAGQLEGMGVMPKGTWVRVDPPMLVLGEHHGNPIAPEVIKSTHVKKYRYEGFTHHSETRLGNSKDNKMRDTLTMLGEERNERNGLSVGVGDPTHDAEHALPKYARILADAIELVKRQHQNGKDVGGKSSAVGADLTAGYSLPKALIDGTLAALVYAQSYGEKRMPHRVKKAYQDNKAAIDTSVNVLSKHKEGAASKHSVPNFNAMGLTVPVLTALHAAYRKVAQEKVGLDSEDKREGWKKKLNLKDEGEVALTKEAKEDDYLRDKSMLDTITKAISAGDRLFVIGDAHRKKLDELIKKAGARPMNDEEFLKSQQELDLHAAGGASYSHLEQARKKVDQNLRKPMVPPKAKVGEKFNVTRVNGCTWEATKGRPDGEPNEKFEEFVIDADTTMSLVWAVNGKRVVVKTWNVKAMPNDPGGVGTRRPGVPQEEADEAKQPE
ncbi:MAG: DUF4157 domain-containing protein [Myxococcales bacterium]|nr:DUF4157 domain-containing protein [Myxococcales bacterium]